jgi:hypothetical protein
VNLSRLKRSTKPEPYLVLLTTYLAGGIGTRLHVVVQRLPVGSSKHASVNCSLTMTVQYEFDMLTRHDMIITVDLKFYLPQLSVRASDDEAERKVY